MEIGRKSVDLAEENARLRADLLALQIERQEAGLKIEMLETELDNLKRIIYGQKRERFVSNLDPNQLVLELGLEEPEEKKPATEEIAAHTRQKPAKKTQPTGRQPWPAHLKRVETILLPEGDLTEMVKISEHRTEFLEYIPSQPFVRVIVRPIFADPQPDPETLKTRVVVAELPPRLVPKFSVGVGMLAAIICDKFLDHLPLYRQIKRYIRLGVNISSSTMANWLTLVAQQLEPLYLALKKEVFATDYLMVDETRMQVLAKTHNLSRKKKKEPPGKTHRGYFWTYYGPKIKLCFFEYCEGRGSEHPTLSLDGFTGKIQTDGYVVYDQFDKTSSIILIGCMAHARRKFFEAKSNDQNRSNKVLAWIQQLYAIERQANTFFEEVPQGALPREEWMARFYQHRYQLRQEKARPIWDQFSQGLDLEKDQTLPKSAIGKAITYTLNRKTYLARYLEDGKLEIDNNLVENQIRPVALGRKNYLFAGSAKGAERAAMFYSLLASCTQNQIDPFTWLHDVMLRLPLHPINQIDQLLPHKWKPDPSAAPIYRITPEDLPQEEG